MSKIEMRTQKLKKVCIEGRDTEEKSGMLVLAKSAFEKHRKQTAITRKTIFAILAFISSGNIDLSSQNLC